MPEKSFVHNQVISTQSDISVKASAENKEPIRLEYVDSIRGIAAISVVIAHFIVPV